jgi:hypothetical protein
MVCTLEGPGIPAIQTTEPGASMAAGIDEDADVPLRISPHNHRFFSHKMRQKISGLRKLGFVRYVQPTVTEDPFLLVSVNLRIDKHTRAHGSSLQVNQVCPVRHRVYSMVTSCSFGA